MRETWNQVRENPDSGFLLGFEHPGIITLGRRSDPQDIQGSSLPVFQTDRGGQATLHTPGQLVIYPIFHLRDLGWGIKEFIEALLVSTENLLASWEISTQRAEPAGLQTSSGKIAFLGLRVDQGITRHGLSLNLSNDLEHFKGIRACGQMQAKIDRVANHKAQVPTLEQAFWDWQAQFQLLLKNPSFERSVGAVGSAFP